MIRRVLALLAFLACAARPAFADQIIQYYTWTAAIATAATTVVLAPQPSAVSLWFVGFQASGTESAALVYLEYGTKTSTNCDTGTVRLLPGTVILPVTAQDVTTYFSGVAMSNLAGSIVPANAPLIIPANVQLCAVSSGTTIAFYPIIWYSLG